MNGYINFYLNYFDFTFYVNKSMPSLNLAINRLVNTASDHFAIWAVKSPYPSGHVMYDCDWPENLNQVWKDWQQMFTGHSGIDILSSNRHQPNLNFDSDRKGLPYSFPDMAKTSQQQNNFPAIANNTGRLMQSMGNHLWDWVFATPILNTLEHCRGMANGQGKPLRFRLDIREPDLIALPWEIMRRPGQPAISLMPNLLFSRTTSDVESIKNFNLDSSLNILLVLGAGPNLQKQKEAHILEQNLSLGNSLPSNGTNNGKGHASCFVKTLIEPTPEQLISELENNSYNVFFYAGHGMRGPDGGLLFVRDDRHLNGIELAQILTSTGVKLAVFNSCWGAQPAVDTHRAIPYSSLAEVLICHGVPAVLGMRDEIADEESLCFIQSFSTALREGKSIDKAVADARQQLLVIYKFNFPTWTLPVLYMHPDYDGELLRSDEDGITTTDTYIPDIPKSFPLAYLRSQEGEIRNLRVGINHIGRIATNDIVIPEAWVTRERHAEIFCRNNQGKPNPRIFFLRDSSANGTWIKLPQGWQQIFHEEIPLEPGMELKFGSNKGQVWVFIVES
jgi:hypothetical protein